MLKWDIKIQMVSGQRSIVDLEKAIALLSQLEARDIINFYITNKSSGTITITGGSLNF